MTGPPRVERTFVIRGELGLHARPAGRFASQAGQYACEISLSRGGPEDEWVNGQSVLSLLSLAASQGTRLVLRAEGEDAQEAVDTLGALLEDETSDGTPI